jgi:hypothetical protein
VTIGLLGNAKLNAAECLTAVGRALRRRHPSIELVNVTKRFGSSGVTPAMLDALRGANAVIAGVGD